MNSQLLIVKIQSLLNGKTVPTESEIKSLCDEYNAIRNACADRTLRGSYTLEQRLFGVANCRKRAARFRYNKFA